MAQDPPTAPPATKTVTAVGGYVEVNNQSCQTDQIVSVGETIDGFQFTLNGNGWAASVDWYVRDRDGTILDSGTATWTSDTNGFVVNTEPSYAADVRIDDNTESGTPSLTTDVHVSGLPAHNHDI